MTAFPLLNQGQSVVLCLDHRVVQVLCIHLSVDGCNIGQSIYFEGYFAVSVYCQPSMVLHQIIPPRRSPKMGSINTFSMLIYLRTSPSFTAFFTFSWALRGQMRKWCSTFKAHFLFCPTLLSSVFLASYACHSMMSY